ncbi:CMT1A duplicated region transcript 1 protein [Tachyglossus aculeatus]|uniref:CMT1A duplicated region transcript 1 protein n=1 Tax=Tachyglossus aculeatus TaxID=9261 RepID=UPI0018F6A36E|nr:CMT1A duplicated region transcript 1 protein [Tachyglossus aculeatus]
MKEPLLDMERLEFRLSLAPGLRCQKQTDLVPVCRTCQTCLLARIVFVTREWFQRSAAGHQRKFLVGIFQRLKSPGLLTSVWTLLGPSQGKDFLHARTYLGPRPAEEAGGSPLGHVPRKEKLEAVTLATWKWFARQSYWTKANFTVHLLQMCSPALLNFAASLLRDQARLVDVEQKARAERIVNIPGDASKREIKLISKRGKHSSSSDSSWDSSSDTQIIRSAVSPEKQAFLQYIFQEADINLSETRSRAEKLNSRFEEEEEEKVLRVEPGLLLETKVLPAITTRPASLWRSTRFSQYMDFIRYLPIHLSKYILGLLDPSSLNKCISVSRHWAFLARQVKQDHVTQKSLQELIVLLQGSYPRGINPSYASWHLIPVPKVTEDGEIIKFKGLKWKLRTKNEYSLEAAYYGQETEMIPMEERNIFCSTYNVRILTDTWEQNRVIHYCGGELVALGSTDRKIRLLDIFHMKEVPPVFQGHAGSIRALILSEKDSFVLSGSYDLSIRCWSMVTGTCTRIFNGHMGTITALDLYENRLASGARDCQVKVWDIISGKCLRTFKHKDPVLCTRIDATYIVSGCEQGQVSVWHFDSATLVKTLNGHEGAVKCLCFDQWHLLSGSVDGYVLGWSMVGKHQRCLTAFKHPREVLHVAFLYLRVISSCADGKIRIFNFLTGACLKVMRVNSRGDPANSFYIKGNRMVINTESNIMMFQFENIQWDYANGQPKIATKSVKPKAFKSPKQGPLPYPEGASSQKQTKPTSRKASEEIQVKGWDFPRKHSVPSAPFLHLPLSARNRSPPAGSEAHRSPAAEAAEVILWQGKRRGPRPPMSPDRLLLRVSTLQRAHMASAAGSQAGGRAHVRGAWGSAVLPSSRPRKALPFRGLPFPEPPDAEGQAEDVSLARGLKRIMTPFEIQKLRPNVRRSLQGPDIRSHIPEPVLVRSGSCGSLKNIHRKAEPDPVWRADVHRDGEARLIGRLVGLQAIRPEHMVIGIPWGTAPLPKERPHLTVPNPYRVNSGFRLLTVKEMEESRDSQVAKFQAMMPTGPADPDRARRISWVRKIKGLPIDRFMKEGKTAAPELGRNLFL